MTDASVISVGPGWHYIVTCEDEPRVLVMCPNCGDDVEMPYDGEAGDAALWPSRLEPKVRLFSEQLSAECVNREESK